jgi:hypothetical protein
MGSLQQTEQLARAAVDEATAERAAKAAQLAELEAKKTSVDSSLSEVSGVELAKTIASDPGLRSQARDVASELGLPKDAGFQELGQAVSDLSDLSNRVVTVWRLLGRSRHAWRRRGLVLGLAAAVGTLAWFLTTHAAAPGIIALGSLAVALGSVARTVSAVARPGSAVIARAQDFFASAEQKEKEAEQARADREKALQNELAQLNVAIAQKQAQLDRDTFQLGQVKAKFGPGDHDAARFYERVLGGFASDDYRDRLGVVSAIQRDFEQLARLLPEGKFNGLPKIDRIILYIDDLDRCSAEQVVQVLQAVHLLLAFPLFVVVVGVDLRWLMRSLRVHHAALAAADATTVDQRGDELAGLAATPQAYLEKIFQIPFRLRPMDSAGSAKLLADLLPVTPPPGPGEPEPGEAAPEPAGTADGGHPAAPATRADEPTASAAPAASITPEPSSPVADVTTQTGTAREPDATATELDLPPRSMRLEPRELEFLQQLVPLIPTPRAVKRLANEYRLVRATIPDSQLATFLDDQYPVVMFLLALLVGRPQVAERLLAALRQPVEPDDSPLSVDDLLSRSAADRADPAVRDAARLLPPGDPVTVMRQWAPYVSRFSFYASD